MLSDLKGNDWKTVMTLDRNREIISGTTEYLASAIRRGADMRIYTEFRHNEHIDPVNPIRSGSGK